MSPVKMTRSAERRREHRRGMSGPDLDQAHSLGADGVVERTLEGACRHRDINAVEVKRREDFRKKSVQPHPCPPRCA